MLGEEVIASGTSVPILVTPDTTGQDLAKWAKENQEIINDNLNTHGAILFRNFKINGARHFQYHVTALADSNLLDYNNRSTPRSNVQGKVYTSTEYPLDQVIPLHNENAYSNKWAKKLFFFCLKSAAKGGETPIADSRLVYQSIPVEIREKFERKKVMYVRNYGKLDLSWQEVFQTSCKESVNELCTAQGIEAVWHDEESLTTRQVCQSTLLHPVTKEKVWFNQAHLFHISNLNQEIREGLLNGENSIPRNAYYGDGEELEEEVLSEIRQAYEKHKICFPWCSGDLLMLDNILFCHGRNPYEGERKVLVAMTDEMSNDIHQA